MSCFFFFSYAKDDLDDDLDQFYQDISQEIRGLMKEQQGMVGFRDEKIIQVVSVQPPAQDRTQLQLLDTLKYLLPAQFEEILFTYNVPQQYLSAGSQAQQAMDIIRYAEYRNELALLQQVIESRTGLFNPPQFREVPGKRLAEGENDRQGAECLLQVEKQWPESLAKALKSARVLIYLHSPAYFAREWCGKEYQIFHTRIEQYRKKNPGSRPSLMVPVVWIPEKYPPAFVADIQFAHDSLGKVYAKEGLRYLMRLKRHEDDYQEFLTRLAQRIVEEAKKHPLPEFTRMPEFKEIKNAFADLARPGGSDRQRRAGPRYAQFVYVAGQADELQDIKEETAAYGEAGEDWKPFFPPLDDDVALIAQRSATDEKFRYDVIPIDEHLTNAVEEAQHNNKIVIIIVDPWTLWLPQYAAIMEKYDRYHFFNCTVLVPFNFSDKQTLIEYGKLRHNLADVFDNKTLDTNPDTFRDEIKSEQELSDSLIDALRKTKQKILRRSDRLRKVKGQGFSSKPVIHAMKWRNP